jgi:hypothetical protein
MRVHKHLIKYKSLFGFILGAVCHSLQAEVNFSEVQVVNVSTNTFSVFWQSSEASVPGLKIYADSEGTIPVELTTQFYPLNKADVTVATTYVGRQDRRALQSAVQDNNFVVVSVTDCQPGTTYFFEPESFDSEGNRNGTQTGHLYSVTTSKLTSFIGESRQLSITVEEEDPEGMVALLSSDLSAFPLLAVVGDASEPDKAYFNFDHLLNLSGVANAIFSGENTFTVRLYGSMGQMSEKQYSVVFDGSFVVADFDSGDFNSSVSYESWLLAFFSDSELNNSSLEENLWGVNANPDMDARVNGLEYALGLDPLDPSDGGTGFSVEISEEINGQNYLVISFRRRLDDFNLVYIPEVSSDLVTWDSGLEFFEFSNALGIDQRFEERTYRDLTPITSNSSRFIRLRVTTVE